jgi:hypothetical protein
LAVPAAIALAGWRVRKSRRTGQQPGIVRTVRFGAFLYEQGLAAALGGAQRVSIFFGYARFPADTDIERYVIVRFRVNSNKSRGAVELRLCNPVTPPMPLYSAEPVIHWLTLQLLPSQ